MAHRIEPTKHLGQEVARIARELLRAGASAVASEDESWEQRVHHARTTCKKVRALLRLLRTRQRGFFRRENRRLRRAADSLAVFRDAKALLSAARKLAPAGRKTGGPPSVLQRRLTAHHRAILADRKVIREHLADFSRELRASLAAMKAWRPREHGFTAIAPEIEARYRKARHIGKRLDRQSTGKDYHEWRKAVKSFGYQCWYLREAWPEMTRPFFEEVDRLSELLGTEHDLTGLHVFVTKTAGANRNLPAADRLIVRQIDRRRLGLRRGAQVVAARLFAEKPRAYVARLRRWWEFAAQNPGGSQPARGS